MGRPRFLGLWILGKKLIYEVYCIYTKPELYGRYIDDCISATSTRKELTQFISAINSFHQALKYTWEISDTSSAFLDVKI